MLRDKYFFVGLARLATQLCISHCRSSLSWWLRREISLNKNWIRKSRCVPMSIKFVINNIENVQCDTPKSNGYDHDLAVLSYRCSVLWWRWSSFATALILKALGCQASFQPSLWKDYTAFSMRIPCMKPRGRYLMLCSCYLVSRLHIILSWTELARFVYDNRVVAVFKRRWHENDACIKVDNISSEFDHRASSVGQRWRGDSSWFACASPTDM